MRLELIFSTPITDNGVEDRTGYCPRKIYKMPYKNKQDLYSNQIARWIKIKHKAIKHMGGSCQNCGYNKYYGALEFHHLNPTQKDVSWNKLRLRAWHKIIKELDKCVMLCSNCHKEEHHRILAR